MRAPKRTSNNEGQNRRDEIIRAILVALSVVGILSIALVAPNALQILLPNSGKRRGKIRPWDVERALNRLLHGGYVQKMQRHGSTFVKVTGEGRRKLTAIELQRARIKIPAKWDGKWRLVFFDIPQRKGIKRDALRRKLKELGFIQIQKSVYLHPYECYNIIRGMQDFYQIKPHFHYAVVEKIENGGKYLRHFNLPMPHTH